MESSSIIMSDDTTTSAVSRHEGALSTPTKTTPQQQESPVPQPQQQPIHTSADDNFNTRTNHKDDEYDPEHDNNSSKDHEDDHYDDNDQPSMADPREEQQRLLVSHRQRKRERGKPPRMNEASPFWAATRTQSSIADYISKSPLLGGSGSGSPFSWGQSSNQSRQRAHKAGQHVLLLRENHVSLDQLNPHPSCRTRKSSTVSAMINLVATVCGGGVLSLPLAFSKAGIVPTTLLMLYGAIVTDFCLVCLVDAARKTGGRTYGDVAAAAFGSVSQVVTTLTIGLMLCGTMIAYQVLVRDIWTPVVFFLLQQMAPSASEDDDHHHPDGEIQVDIESANILLACILVIALPLLWKKDLYALRHTCYVGFGSCVLLMVAVVYRAYEKFATELTVPNAETTTSNTTRLLMDVNSSATVHVATELTTYTATVKWWADEPSDIIFAFPIVVLCFFCSYNVLGVHSQLVNPTRSRIRFVLGLSMFLCWSLFFLVGLCGYLYTSGGETPDNILLAFELQDKAILAGRMGFCLTLLFGLPLVLLPTRDALTSLPEQIRAWRRDADLISQYKKLNSTYQDSHSNNMTAPTTDSIRSLSQLAHPTERTSLQQNAAAPSDSEGVPHLVINGVDFDGKEPKLICRDPEMRHGTAILYGSTDPVNRSTGTTRPERTKKDWTPPATKDEAQLKVKEEPTADSQSSSSIPKANSATVTTTSASVSATIATASEGDEQAEDDDMMMPEEFTFEGQKGIQIHNGEGGDSQGGILDCPSWWDSVVHGGATIAILVVTYGVAITVPGVASVWSIVGSSMAIWIAFVVPTSCFLKIRQHKGLTMQALYAWIVLVISLIAMVICTKQAVYNAFHSLA
mmetsp:Transcript_10465/g.28943  ORF Transcript_10465/g.28943 Transcript_10465/m.28943 type:complete len:854 (+) Transcript_10465:135-2696(+)|eukprot:CAMPEP_0168722692 /NCGR_PEP_ID=MMETSP0724-20121128/2728_1 /TAXON_ID=265536 /ORGANISM="Amphiprora sp., Strain CCMP467" /LENGTH=853 /DNA_ID=CAMNT_0008769371 /DNA_START=80 /DNA_END=2641 /DNA_ORIENTATION=-